MQVCAKNCSNCNDKLVFLITLVMAFFQIDGGQKAGNEFGVEIFSGAFG